VSLIPANIEYLGFAVQSGKGSPAAAPTICVALEDCSLEPNRSEVITQESDASAQAGERVVVGAKPGGTFKKYLRASEEDFFLYALLGKNVDAGTTPKTHTANVDPAAPFTTPYLTVWDVWPGVATVRYDDVRVGQAAFTGQPGQVLSVEYTLVGRSATLGVTEPASPPAVSTETPLSWADLTATLNAAHPGTVNQFGLTIDRNTSPFDGDNGLTAFDVVNGLLDIKGNIEIAFEDDDRLRAANTGDTAGTALTTDIYEESLTLDLARGSDTEVKFTMTAVQIGNYKVSLKTDATPAVATFDFNTKRQTTANIANVLQTLVKNSIALAARA